MTQPARSATEHTATSRLSISLRVALIGINLLILLLPIAGLQLMRLYESSLVRQTESALIAQGAFVAAFYRSIIERRGTQDFAALSKPNPKPLPDLKTGNWYPRPATLDLATSPVMPPFPDPLPLSPSLPATVGTTSPQGIGTEAMRLGKPTKSHLKGRTANNAGGH